MSTCLTKFINARFNVISIGIRTRLKQLSLYSIFITLSYSSIVQAVEIPQGLTQNQLPEVTELLGFSTGSKFLGNPYALGGYPGFAVGFSTELVDIENLADLGNGAARESTFQYNRITVGKGLFNNIDGYFHFIPFSSSNEVSEYGGMIKWMFYDTKSFPLSLSVIGQTSTINVQDVFVNELIGLDLLAGLNLNTFAIYFGGGTLRSRSMFSRFILDAGVPLSDGSYVLRSNRTHTFAGLYVDIERVFLAIQIDRLDQPVYSAKIGYRL